MATSRNRSGRRRRILRLLLMVGCILFFMWGAGFYNFARMIPSETPPEGVVTDAIVVLTGGAGRVAEGLSLLETGAAQKLFVSGVYRGVDVQVLLRVAQRAPGNLECCIILGYAADNTRGNARETADWVRQQNLTSIRLVTASYHMPRSLFEFGRTLPATVRVLPHPVFPQGFSREDWWQWRRAGGLAVSEYHKYLLARIGALVERAR